MADVATVTPVDAADVTAVNSAVTLVNAIGFQSREKIGKRAELFRRKSQGIFFSLMRYKDALPISVERSQSATIQERSICKQVVVTSRVHLTSTRNLTYVHVRKLLAMNRTTVLTWTKRIFSVVLGGLLAFAGVLKIQDNSALFESVAYITWIPVALKSLVIDTLPYVEVVVGSLLVLQVAPRITRPVVTAIYLSFFLFAIYGLGSGMEGDCGCFGELSEGSLLNAVLGSSFGWKMVIRNGVFLLMALTLFIPDVGRVIPAVEQDDTV